MRTTYCNYCSASVQVTQQNPLAGSILKQIVFVEGRVTEIFSDSVLIHRSQDRINPIHWKKQFIHIHIQILKSL